MKRLALGLLIFTFALSLNLAYAQDKKDLKIANKKYSHTDTTYKHDHKLMTPEQTVVTNPTDAIAKAEIPMLLSMALGILMAKYSQITRAKPTPSAAKLALKSSPRTPKNMSLNSKKNPIKLKLLTKNIV